MNAQSFVDIKKIVAESSIGGTIENVYVDRADAERICKLFEVTGEDKHVALHCLSVLDLCDIAWEIFSSKFPPDAKKIG